MIACKHCNTPNSLDSTFCKRCGTGLPEDDVNSGKAKLAKVVEEGNQALSLGKLEEAGAVAEMAVSSDPSMAAAWSLKSHVHERRGEIAEALEAAEKIVELNPDSELDKIKRNQLRASLGAAALRNQPPNRAVAGVVAVSMAALVICAAILGQRAMTRGPVPKVVSNEGTVASNQVVQRPLVNPADPGPIAPQPNQPVQDPNQTQKPNADPAPTDPGPTHPNVVREPSSSNDTGDTLPDTTRLTPISPKVPNDLNAGNQAPSIPAPAPKKSVDNNQDPSPVPENSGKTPTAVAQTPPSDPGEIDITVHHDRPLGTKGGSSGSADDSKGADKVYMRMGNEYYQMGRYGSAAANLEKAVTSGADPVNANYRLAQTYKSMGRNGDAAEAYKRAISAASNSINSGKGDLPKLKAVRDACETALHQVQGG